MDEIPKIMVDINTVFRSAKIAVIERVGASGFEYLIVRYSFDTLDFPGPYQYKVDILNVFLDVESAAHYAFEEIRAAQAKYIRSRVLSEVEQMEFF